MKFTQILSTFFQTSREQFHLFLFLFVKSQAESSGICLRCQGNREDDSNEHVVHIDSLFHVWF